jgi:hypothetical protein
VKLVYLVGFIAKKFVAMHGHMNVKIHSKSCFEGFLLGMNKLIFFMPGSL